MNGDLIITLILFSISGLPFLILGYLVAIKKKTSIIAGWDESNVKDPDSYAKVFGWTGIFCGLFLAVTTYIFSANTISVFMWIGSSVVAVFIQLLAAGYCNIKYSRS